MLLCTHEIWYKWPALEPTRSSCSTFTSRPPEPDDMHIIIRAELDEDSCSQCSFHARAQLETHAALFAGEEDRKSAGV